MDIEKFERMVKLVQADVKGISEGLHVSDYPSLVAEIRNLMVFAPNVLPDHKEFFKNISEELKDFDDVDTKMAIEHILAILQIEKSGLAKVKGMKIFESANDKLKQAGLSFRNGDYTSVFHNLNTALELVLKDKLAIPTTITGINTSNIIDIWVKHKLGAHLYLAETRKRVLKIDNKVKHQGYSPSKTDCINGIKAMEELISRLRGKEISLTEEIKKKIYEGL